MYGPALGMRFLPTDTELIIYLWMQVKGSPLPPTLIHECDIYEQEPWNVPRDFIYGVGKEMYYFTPRHRTSTNGSGCRANCNTGEGFWHGNGRDQLIFDAKSSKLIGHKTSLVFRFRDNKRKRLHPNWIMHEYTLHSPDGKFQEMALCRIHPKGDNKEADDHHPAAPDCKKRWIHAMRSTPLFDQAYEAKDYSRSDGVVKATATSIEQNIAPQLAPPVGVVDDRSTSTSLSSTSSFIDSDISKWIDSVILSPLSSSTSVPSSSQPIEVPISSNSGNPSNADVLEWIDSMLAVEDSIVAQSSSFATGSPINHPISAYASEWAAILEAGENAFALGLL